MSYETIDFVEDDNRYDAPDFEPIYGLYRKKVSEKLAYFNESISNSISAYQIDESIANQLFSDSRSFRYQCSEVIREMRLAYARKKNLIWEGLSGWSLAPYDPDKLIQYFNCLSIRKGYRLSSYQSQSNAGNGSAFVFVIPKDRNLPKRPPIKYLDSMYFGTEIEEELPLPVRNFGFLRRIFPSYRSLPDWVEDDIEPHIEGDGSPLSYFQASIFFRELYELGSMWHCVWWGHHDLITSIDKLPEKKWNWEQSKPVSLIPIVWKDKNQRWNVTFYTYDDMNADFNFHNDIFGNGYEFKTCSTLLASHEGIRTP